MLTFKTLLTKNVLIKTFCPIDTDVNLKKKKHIKYVETCFTDADMLRRKHSTFVLLQPD